MIPKKGIYLKITLSSTQIIRFLSGIAIVLIMLNSIMLILYFYIDNPDKFNFIQLVDLDQETNLPTLFSSAILLIAGLLFYLLANVSAINSTKKKKYWIGLSIVFVFLAFDESATLHERLGDWTEQYVNTNGYLHYPWVISYSLLVLILGFFYLKFFLTMERKNFWSFMKAAMIFLIGAIGFELLGAKEASMHGSDTMLYCYYYTIEESLEMFGVIYLIDVLLKLLDGHTVQIHTK